MWVTDLCRVCHDQICDPFASTALRAAPHSHDRTTTYGCCCHRLEADTWITSVSCPVEMSRWFGHDCADLAKYNAPVASACLLERGRGLRGAELRAASRDFRDSEDDDYLRGGISSGNSDFDFSMQQNASYFFCDLEWVKGYEFSALGVPGRTAPPSPGSKE